MTHVMYDTREHQPTIRLLVPFSRADLHDNETLGPSGFGGFVFSEARRTAKAGRHGHQLTAVSSRLFTDYGPGVLTAMGKLRIKNWTEYQHYHDRCPPWIKLHSSILDDPDWRSLSDTSKAHLVSIWALASRLHGDPNTDAEVPDAAPYLSALTGCRITTVSLQLLVDKGFLVPCGDGASGLLADCKPSRDAHAHSVSVSYVKNSKNQKDAGFAEFWRHYPKRVGKRDALKAWKQTAKERPPLEQLIGKVDELAVSRGWLKDSGQWIPYPATWLRAGGWDDEVRTKQ